MNSNFIFDLDQTIVESTIAEEDRKRRNWQEVYRLIPSFKVYEGILSWLAEILESGGKIAIVTSSPSTYATKVLTYFNIPRHLVVGYHDTKNRKPHPEPILFALSALKFDPRQTFSLGDREMDIRASKSAGVKSCACYWGSNEVEALKNSNAEHHFKTVEEAVSFFRSRI
jgi:HAD superfamily hydrolase (TIGR01549 family)